MFDKEGLIRMLRTLGAGIIFIVALWALAIAPLRQASAIDPEAIARQVAGLSDDSTVAAINGSLAQVAADLQHQQLLAQSRLGFGVALLGLAILIRPTERRRPEE